MTTDSVHAGGDPRRLLSDVRALAHRVRLDQRVTWVALLVLTAVTVAAIPVDWFSVRAECAAVLARDSSACQIRRLGAMFYWPPALLLAYTGIAVYAARVARARGLGARVLPYVLTGVGLTVLSATAWVLVRVYLNSHPPFILPTWMLPLDRLIGPAGTIGVALLVLAWLERHVALLLFTLGYLAVVLVPIDFAWHPEGFLTSLVAPQVINGIVLLLGTAGFAAARRWHR